MKLLVTGGAGFIGSYFIEYVMKRHPSWEIICYDKLTYAGDKKRLKNVNRKKNFHFIKGDICDFNKIQSVASDKDVIVNFAAESSVDKSILSSGEFLKTNLLGVGNILSIVKKWPQKKLIQISTDEVYGSIRKGSATEDFPLMPRNPYAATKAAADMLILSNVATFGCKAIIVRSCNNFGPHQNNEKLIPCFIEKLLSDQPVTVYGRGRNVREWIHVEDFCRAIDLVIRKGQSGETYNVSSGNFKTNMEITRLLLKILNKPTTLISHVKDCPGHDFRYAMSSKKITKLGWKPLREFNAAFEETVEWYQNESFKN